MLPETLGMGRMPPAAAHTIIVTILYLPPLLETLGLAEVTHEPRNNRMRAV